MLRNVILFGSIFAGSAVGAEPVALTKQAINETVAGSTLELDLPMGTKLPVRYSHDGHVSGEAGNLAWYLGSPTDHGRWWVANDKLCHKWFKWFDAKNQCLQLRQDGARLHWTRDDGETGTATIIRRSEPIQTAALPVAPTPQSANPIVINSPAQQSASLPAAPQPVEAIAPVSQPAPAVPKVVQRLPNLAPPTKDNPVTIAQAPRAAAVPLPISRQSQSVPIRPAAPSFAGLAPSFKVAGVDDDDVLNVREGPSADYDAIGEIPPQAEGVTISGPCQLEWCPIVHRNLKGWVNRYYLVEENRSDGGRVSR